MQQWQLKSGTLSLVLAWMCLGATAQSRPGVYEEVEFGEILQGSRPYTLNPTSIVSPAAAAALHPAIPVWNDTEDGESFRRVGSSVVHPAWVGVLDQDVVRAKVEPTLLSSLVGVGRIVDQNHSAFIHRTGEHAYLAFSKHDLPAHTVLGFYGGHVKLLSEGRAQERWPLRAGKTMGMLDLTLVVDGNHAGNELNYVNDFRQDVTHWDDSSRQNGSAANAAVVEVWFADERAPRLMFVSVSPLEVGAEITIDYGITSWRKSPPKVPSLLTPLVPGSVPTPIPSAYGGYQIHDFLDDEEIQTLLGDGTDSCDAVFAETDLQQCPETEGVRLSNTITSRLSAALGVDLEGGTMVGRETHRCSGREQGHYDSFPDGSSLGCDSAMIYLATTANATMVIQEQPGAPEPVVDSRVDLCTAPIPPTPANAITTRVTIRPGTLVRIPMHARHWVESEMGAKRIALGPFGVRGASCGGLIHAVKMGPCGCRGCRCPCGGTYPNCDPCPPPPAPKMPPPLPPAKGHCPEFPEVTLTLSLNLTLTLNLTLSLNLNLTLTLTLSRCP